MAGTDSTDIALNLQEKLELLSVARRAILHRLTHSASPPIGEDDVSENLRLLSGAFVSLHIEEELRGCIGSIYAEEPLFRIVGQMAIQAATEDPRFPPLTNSELPRTDIEVSVLSELKPIAAADVEVGVHGLFLSRGSRRGLLLPQVPGQYGWNRKHYLGQLCLKAGLPDRAWADPESRLLMFTADVFSDSSLYDDPDLPDDI